MDLSQAFGLPSHPLIVHIPIVVIPLTLLAAIGAVAWPRGRRVPSLVTAGAAFVGDLPASAEGGD